MATVTASVAIDMALMGTTYAATPDNVLEAGATTIRLRAPNGNIQTYTGSFAYTVVGAYSYLDWPASTLTGLAEAGSGGSPQWAASNFSVSGTTYQAYVNQADVLGLTTHVLQYADVIEGSSYGDKLYGYAGDDTLSGGGGDDLLDGGAGTDVAVFSGNRSQYALSATASGWTLSGGEGSDTLAGIESARFADQTISLGNYAPTGSVAIGGNVASGQVLTATNTLTDFNGLGSVGYQWQMSADGLVWYDIAGATGSALALPAGAVGLRLRVVGSYTDLHGNAESVVSAATAAVADGTPPPAPKLVTGAGFNFVVDPQVTMQTSLGTVVLELDPERAPVTVANMLAYVDAGYYDGTLFHRVIPGFMVQGGGLTSGLAAKTPTYAPIVLESNNGLSNLRGTIAMARTNAADSATTQFFINHVDNGFLDYASAASPGYAVFGRVVSGLTAVDAIAQVATATVAPYANVPVSEVAIATLRQTLAGSAYSHAATLTVAGLETGAQWSYSLDGGTTWNAGSGSSFVVPVGSYAAAAIQVRQTDAAGNPSAAPGKLGSALVVETTAPSVASFSPADGADAVAPASNIVVGFSEAIARGSGSIVLKTAAGAVVESFDAAASARLSLAGAVLTIDPTADLAPDTLYKVELAAGSVQDLAGNAYAGSSAYDFSTFAHVNASPLGGIRVTGQPAAGQTLTAAARLVDADGLGTLTWQWQSSADGSVWSDIAGATDITLALGAERIGQQLRIAGSYRDGYGTQEVVHSAAIDVFAAVPPRSASFLAYAWKSHAVLDGVAIATDAGSQTTAGDGSASIAGLTGTRLNLTASRPIPAAEADASAQAVNLQDAIAVLKMIVGLDVNGADKPLSPYQTHAADFDGSGAVQLTDAIGILKHVVGLVAPAPQWLFFNEDEAAPGGAGLSADLSAATTQVHAGLVGVLRGDVDGSYAGLPQAIDLDLARPGYFQHLAALHGLDAAQFGVYAA